MAIFLVVLAVVVAPAHTWWPTAQAEYPPGPLAKLRCLRDCIFLGWGGYHPALDKIRIRKSERLLALVPPFRLDQRRLGGMGECASIGENHQGRVLAAWMMRDPRGGQTYKVYGRWLRPEGSFLGPDFRINTGASAGLLGHHVSLRVDRRGWFTVLWHAARHPGQLVRGGAGVFLKRFQPDGQAAGPEVRVSPSLAGEMAEMGGADDGTLAVVWSDKGTLWGRRVRPDDRMDAPVRLDDTPSGTVAEFPAVACGPSGEAVVAWVDTREGGRDIRARWLDAALHPKGPSLAVGPGPVPRAFFRMVSVGATNRGYGIVWLAPNGQWGRWLDPRAKPLGGVQRLLRATSEVCTLSQPNGALWVCNGRSLRAWAPGFLGELIPLLEEPAEVDEPALATSSQGLWVTWHEAFERRLIPALGDNYFIMAARVLPEGPDLSKPPPAAAAP